jgi:hypothetical protein
VAFGRAAAGVFALGQGYFMDLFSGGPQGLFSAVYLGAFGIILVAGLFFDFQSRRGQAMIVFLAVLGRKILFAAVPAQILAWPPAELILYLAGIPGSALLAGLLTPLLFELLKVRQLSALEGLDKRVRAEP